MEISDTRRTGSSKKKTTESKEVKFYPHTSGQQHTVTFDTVKDRIIQQVQKTYRHGVDVAESLRNEEKKDLSASEPTRELSTATDETQRFLEQQGHDIKYKVKIAEYFKWVEQLDENMNKAYALIFDNYCSRTMQVHIEEHKDFDSTIRDDPIELLKAIRILMHAPIRAKYPYASILYFSTMLRKSWSVPFRMSFISCVV